LAARTDDLKKQSRSKFDITSLATVTEDENHKISIGDGWIGSNEEKHHPSVRWRRYPIKDAWWTLKQNCNHIWISIDQKKVLAMEIRCKRSRRVIDLTRGSKGGGGLCNTRAPWMCMCARVVVEDVGWSSRGRWWWRVGAWVEQGHENDKSDFVNFTINFWLDNPRGIYHVGY